METYADSPHLTDVWLMNPALTFAEGGMFAAEQHAEADG